MRGFHLNTLRSISPAYRNGNSKNERCVNIYESLVNKEESLSMVRYNNF